MKRFTIAILFAVLICSICYSQNKPETPERYASVVSTGYGKNEADAMKSALNSAVEQVVGVMVSSETFIKNGELIKDKILTQSKGFIKSYEKLSSEKENGLIKVTVKAEVSVNRVNTAVKGALGDKVKVDGKNLYAQVVTSSVQDQIEQIDEILAGYRYDILNKSTSVTINSVKVNPAKSNDNITTLLIDFTIKMDEEIYRKEWVNVLEFIEGIGIGVDNPMANGDYFSVWDNRYNKKKYYRYEHNMPKKVSNTIYKFLCSFRAKNIEKNVYTVEFKQGKKSLHSSSFNFQINGTKNSLSWSCYHPDSFNDIREEAEVTISTPLLEKVEDIAITVEYQYP